MTYVYSEPLNDSAITPQLIYNPTTSTFEISNPSNLHATSPYIVCCDIPSSNAVVHTISNRTTEVAS